MDTVTTNPDWNWLEWLHHTSKDMALHTATSYQEAMTALLNASVVLAEAWEDGHKADDNSPNPYEETSA